MTIEKILNLCGAIGWQTQKDIREAIEKLVAEARRDALVEMAHECDKRIGDGSAWAAGIIPGLALARDLARTLAAKEQAGAPKAVDSRSDAATTGTGSPASPPSPHAEEVEALAPCPFCGSAIPDGDIATTSGTDEMQVYCSKCGADGPLARQGPEDDDDYHAVEAWNRRALSSRSAAPSGEAPSERECCDAYARGRHGMGYGCGNLIFQEIDGVKAVRALYSNHSEAPKSSPKFCDGCAYMHKPDVNARCGCVKCHGDDVPGWAKGASGDGGARAAESIYPAEEPSSPSSQSAGLSEERCREIVDEGFNSFRRDYEPVLKALVKHWTNERCSALEERLAMRGATAALEKFTGTDASEAVCPDCSHLITGHSSSVTDRGTSANGYRAWACYEPGCYCTRTRASLATPSPLPPRSTEPGAADDMARRLEQAERAVEEEVKNVEELSDALAETHRALGGDGEWCAKPGSLCAPGETGDLAVDVPALARRVMEGRAASVSAPEPGAAEMLAEVCAAMEETAPAFIDEDPQDTPGLKRLARALTAARSWLVAQAKREKEGGSK